MGSEQFTVFGHSAAGSYRTVLYGTIRCVLVKLKCVEIMYREKGVQLLVHTVYRYDGYCCMCHGEIIVICGYKSLVLLVRYI